jgi:ADP-heptose:LPS heptosyltransferase
MKKILVIQTAFIGDVILATPVIEKLHAFYPEASIDFLLRKGNESLFKEHPFLNRLLIWDKKENKIMNLLKIIQQVRNERYSLVVNIHRFVTSGLITFLSKGKLKAGFEKNPFSFCYDFRARHRIGDKTHEVERNLSLIEKLTDREFLKPKLYPSSADYALIKEYTITEGGYITIAPTSVWYTKQFPAHKWISLINRQDASMTIYLLGAPGDADACEKILRGADHKKVINLAGKLSFLQSAALMRSALMNYVNDSAPLHLASSMNAPATAIFCSTIPAFGFGPLSDRSFIIERTKPLYCRPCGLHGYRACPQGHFKCAEDIII